jgi:hypothetical protein
LQELRVIIQERKIFRKINEGSTYSKLSIHSKYSKKALDVATEINHGRITVETETLHEFILLTLSKAFGANPKQAVGIVPRDFKFLTVTVIKSKKRESTSIRKWYRYINKYMKHLVNVILNDNPQRIESQLYNALNVLKIGIFSQDDETVKLCINSLYSMVCEFSQTYYIGFFWEWFKKQDQVLKAVITAFADYTDLTRTICKFL